MRHIPSAAVVTLAVALLSCGCAPQDDERPAVEASEIVVYLPPVPSSRCPLSTTSVVDASALGVAPDTGANVGVALNHALAAATTFGLALRLQAGTYLIDQPIRVPSGATLFGEGATTVLAASTGHRAWAPGRALVEMIDTRDARLCDVVLDHQGLLREDAAQTLDHTMVMSGATSNLVSRVVFRNPGTRVGAPSGPALLMIARNVGDRGYPGVGVDRSVEANLIEGCTFEIDPRLAMSFAVRMFTDWERYVDPSRFVNRVTRNVLRGNHFNGTFYWNTIELAGGGTTRNTLDGNTFDGLTLTHIDLDKGTSYNVVQGNDVVRGGRAPDALYCFDDPLRATDGACHAEPSAVTASGVVYCCHYPSSAFSDHGSDERYTNVGNTIAKNRVRRLVEEGGLADLNEGAILLQHTRSAQVLGNVVDAVFEGRVGSGIRLVSNVDDVTIAQNRIGADDGAVPRRVRYGLTNGQPDPAAPTLAVSNVAVTSNTFITESPGITVGRRVPYNPEAMGYCDVDGASLFGMWSGWTIRGNTVNTRDTVSLHAVELALNAPVVDHNTVRGGSYNFFLNSPGAVVTGNTSSGAGGRAYAWLARGSLSHNTVSPPPGGCVRMCGAAIIPPPVGNSFVCP